MTDNFDEAAGFLRLMIEKVRVIEDDFKHDRPMGNSLLHATLEADKAEQFLNNVS